jgi:hypothetical protein
VTGQAIARSLPFALGIELSPIPRARTRQIMVVTCLITGAKLADDATSALTT